MTDVEKSEILHIWHVCDIENIAIYAKFMQFSCEEKMSPKVHLRNKNDKYEVWTELLIDTENDNYMMMTNKTEIVDICVV